MKTPRIPIRSAKTVILAVACTIVVGATACGGGSKSSDQPGVPGGGGGLPEPSAFQFIDQNMLEAAFLTADKITVFLEELSELNGIVIELLEDGVVDSDLSELCDGVGSAVFNATPPLGPGGSALITLTDCIDGAIGGTISYGIGLYDADAVLPDGTQIPQPFIGMNMRQTGGRR